MKPLDLRDLTDDEILFLFIKKEQMFAVNQIYSASNEALDIYAYSLFQNKTYSNINVQDSLGNTFLHYAVANHSWHFARLLLIAGSNPYILNNDSIAAFNDNNESRIKYFKKHNLRFEFDTTFAQNVKLMPDKLKEFCFDLSIEGGHNNFENIDDIKKELKKCGLYTKDRFLQAIVLNNDKSKALQYLMTNFNNKKDNCFILRYALLITPPSNQEPIFKSFLNRDLDFDSHFQTLLINRLKFNPNQDSNECLKILLNIIVKQKFYITHAQEILPKLENYSKTKEYFNSLIEKSSIEEELTSIEQKRAIIIKI